eukprot:g16465.t1
MRGSLSNAPRGPLVVLRHSTAPNGGVIFRDESFGCDIRPFDAGLKTRYLLDYVQQPTDSWTTHFFCSEDRHLISDLFRHVTDAERSAPQTSQRLRKLALRLQQLPSQFHKVFVVAAMPVAVEVVNRPLELSNDIARAGVTGLVQALGLPALYAAARTETERKREQEPRFDWFQLFFQTLEKRIARRVHMRVHLPTATSSASSEGAWESANPNADEQGPPTYRTASWEFELPIGFWSGAALNRALHIAVLEERCRRNNDADHQLAPDGVTSSFPPMSKAGAEEVGHHNGHTTGSDSEEQEEGDLLSPEEREAHDDVEGAEVEMERAADEERVEQVDGVASGPGPAEQSKMKTQEESSSSRSRPEEVDEPPSELQLRQRMSQLLFSKIRTAMRRSIQSLQASRQWQQRQATTEHYKRWQNEAHGHEGSAAPVVLQRTAGLLYPGVSVRCNGVLLPRLMVAREWAYLAHAESASGGDTHQEQMLSELGGVVASTPSAAPVQVSLNSSTAFSRGLGELEQDLSFASVQMGGSLPGSCRSWSAAE